jgi:hypothetical protein
MLAYAHYFTETRADVMLAAGRRSRESSDAAAEIRCLIMLL